MAASIGGISGRLVSRLLTSITSGIALTSGCIPPSSKSIQALKIIALSLFASSQAFLTQLTESQTGSLGSLDTLTTVAWSSESST